MRTEQLSPKLAAVAEKIEGRLAGGVERQSPALNAGQLAYEIDSERLVEICRTLRDDAELAFDVMIDLAGVDYLTYGRDEWQTDTATTTGFSRGVFRDEGRDVGTEPYDDDSPVYQPKRRFAAVYQLLSIKHNTRVRLRAFCADDDAPILDSIVAVYSSADWYEREAFDLYGILFRSHPDLRRLLTDYGFIGHPFRKDFPVSGNVEMRYDPARGRVVYEPVTIEPRTLVPKVIRDDHRYEPALKDPSDA